jgi:SAM-dependent methyltransferase
MDVSEYWNQLTDFYQEKDTTTDWLLGYPVVLELLGDMSGKTLLDYGCGYGAFGRFVHDKQPNAHILSIDTSDSAIKHAKNKTPQELPLDFHHIRSYIDIANYQFDSACANFFFCIQPNIDTLVAVSKCIYDQLPVGGSFIVLDPNPRTHGKRFTSFQADSAAHLKSGDKIHVRLFTDSIDLEFDDYYWKRSDYEYMLKAAGFTKIQVEEPIASGSTRPLGAEKEFPPFIIFKATK